MITVLTFWANQSSAASWNILLTDKYLQMQENTLLPYCSLSWAISNDWLRNQSGRIVDFLWQKLNVMKESEQSLMLFSEPSQLLEKDGGGKKNRGEVRWGEEGFGRLTHHETLLHVKSQLKSLLLSKSTPTWWSLSPLTTDHLPFTHFLPASCSLNCLHNGFSFGVPVHETNSDSWECTMEVGCSVRETVCTQNKVFSTWI